MFTKEEMIGRLQRAMIVAATERAAGLGASILIFTSSNGMSWFLRPLTATVVDGALTDQPDAVLLSRVNPQGRAEFTSAGQVYESFLLNLELSPELLAELQDSRHELIRRVFLYKQNSVKLSSPLLTAPLLQTYICTL